MSIKVMSAVWELQLAREEKLVLLAIADHADDDGLAWPSLSRIAWKCGYQQKRTVSDIVRRLIEAGVLETVERAAGPRPTKYRVRPEMAASLPPFDPNTYRRGQSVRRDAENASQGDSEGDKSLNQKEEMAPESARGAENASQMDAFNASLACEQPVDESELGMRSAHTGMRLAHARDAVASAPESYNRHIEPLADDAPGTEPQGRAARRPEPPFNPTVENNEARLLGIPRRRENESVAHFRRRLEVARTASVTGQAERRSSPADDGGVTGTAS